MTDNMDKEILEEIVFFQRRCEYVASTGKDMPKELWPAGPWHKEPDRLEWVDKSTGYPCIALRNMHATGAWCGYVAIPTSHPYHGVNYNDIDLDVHGGLTYSRKCQGDAITGVCHESKDEDDVWWLGFDCAHGNDIAPLVSCWFGEYCDLEYVKKECTKLAKQLKKLEKA
jgi:hypothetical protein